MLNFFRSRLQAFSHAFGGLRHVLRTQHNAWIHTTIAAAVLLLGLWLRLAARDWAVIVLTVALVYTAEFINTSIEAIVDLASPDKHPLARVGKDVGAAAVLVSAVAAILVGFLILGPPFFVQLMSLFKR